MVDLPPHIARHLAVFDARYPAGSIVEEYRLAMRHMIITGGAVYDPERDGFTITDIGRKRLQAADKEMK